MITKKIPAKTAKKSAIKATAAKTPAKPVAVKSMEGKPAVATAMAGKYFEAVGRRKTAICRVRIWPASGTNRQITVNGKVIGDYWRQKDMQDVFMSPLNQVGNLDWKISANINGGGPHSQAEAGRHGVSRALVTARPEYKKVLKAAGFLTRDPRMKERKKPGLKGARRAPQWSKR